MSVRGPQTELQQQPLQRKRAIDDVDEVEDVNTAKRPTHSTPNEPIKTADNRGVVLPFQRQLQLHKVGGEYELAEVPIPEFRFPGEILLEVLSIGLNPIDWKAPKFGFGIPSFPCVYGREFVGRVAAKKDDSHADGVEVGDTVVAISTDYRDYRKAGFQEFAIALSSNVVKVPTNVPQLHLSGVGVAFVAAVLSLGVCFGLRLTLPPPEQATETAPSRDLDLLSLARSQPKSSVPEDVRDEVFWGITAPERPRNGDWIIVMGASAISGQMAVQLANIGGLRVIAVADSKKYEGRLLQLGARAVVDRHNLEEASRKVRDLTKGALRFAFDAVGKDTATWCQTLLAEPPRPENADQELETKTRRAHLVGLSGVPKSPLAHVKCHKLPIKLFHENATIGREVTSRLHDLLATETLKLPEVDIVRGGLEVVNANLEKLRKGGGAGKRIVVDMHKATDE